MKYAGMAFQMLIYFGLGLFIGVKLDEKFKTSDPYFTISGLFLFAGIYFYKLMKDLANTK
ncbi:MAG: AtpZ/AtpI family protein [Saprospiraceae bacterium]